jgi:hypothetical protein
MSSDLKVGDTVRIRKTGGTAVIIGKARIVGEGSPAPARAAWLIQPEGGGPSEAVLPEEIEPIKH